MKPDPSLIVRICPTDATDPSWRQGLLSSITLVTKNPLWDELRLQRPADVLLCHDNKSIYAVALDTSRGIQNVPRQLKVRGEPSRIILSTRLKRLIVLSHELEVVHPRTQIGSRKSPGVRALKPVITFLDPLQNRLPDHTPESPEGSSHTSSSEGHHHRNRVLPERNPGEKFLGITEWTPELKDGKRDMLIINTAIRADTKKAAAGRLLVYFISHQNDSFGLDLKKKVLQSSTVYSVVVDTFTGRVSYCTGSEIGGFYVTEDNGKINFVQLPKMVIQCPIRYMSIWNRFLYASTAEDSLQAFLISGQELTPHTGDSNARNAIHHVELTPDEPYTDNPVILVADQAKSITGLWKSPGSPISNQMTTVFEAANLRDSITRVQRFFSPIWYEKPTPESCHLRDMPENTERGNKALGTGTTGSCTQITVLLPQQWPLLRFVQTLACQNPIIAPFAQEGARVPVLATYEVYVSDPETSRKKTKPTDRHINGDILKRLLERGGIELLSTMLSKDYSRTSGPDRSSTQTGGKNGNSDYDDFDSDNDADMLDIGTGEFPSSRSRSTSPASSSSSSSFPASSNARLAGTPEERWRCFVDLAIQALELERAVDFVPGRTRERWLSTDEGRSEICWLVLRWVGHLLRPLM